MSERRDQRPRWSIRPRKFGVKVTISTSPRTSPRVLHIAPLDKFLPPFVDLLESQVGDFSRHHFILIKMESSPAIRPLQNITVLDCNATTYEKHPTLIRWMVWSDKIILHGLFSPFVVTALAMQPWLLNKCSWVIWGGDLYAYRLPRHTIGDSKREFLRRFVISRMGCLVTYIEGDVELARKWYGARGRHHECLMYTSNLYRDLGVPEKKSAGLVVQIGNSADPSNRHLEILDKLLPFKGEDIRIYAPLSYGDKEYAKTVCDAGWRSFGDKFVPMLDFMPFDDYLKVLSEIDVAIFNHDRQQAMGNIITLIGSGKKVYLRDGVSSWGFLDRIGAVVYKLSEFDLDLCGADVMTNNALAIQKHCSLETLLSQLTDLFEG